MNNFSFCSTGVTNINFSDVSSTYTKRVIYRKCQQYTKWLFIETAATIQKRKNVKFQLYGGISIKLNDEKPGHDLGVVRHGVFVRF
jgi:hypothetical protein